MLNVWQKKITSWIHWLKADRSVGHHALRLVRVVGVTDNRKIIFLRPPNYLTNLMLQQLITKSFCRHVKRLKSN